MGITLQKTDDKEKFNAFVQGHPLGTIHQLWEWGECQSKTAGRDKFWAFELRENKEIVGSALIIRQTFPFKKSWLYCPRGPLFDYSNHRHAAAFFGAIAALAKQENAVFFRFDPPILKDAQFDLKGSRARKAHAHYQPESTLFIDLTQTEEEILKQMKPKGRYNIKVAEKHGVIIKESDDVKAFYQLFRETTSRDRFSGHSYKYYQNMMETLGPDRARLFIATYNNKPLAAAIVTYFADTGTYYFGASSNEHRNVMAPYLLHWHIMKDAKRNGYNTYDLFGIAPEDAKDHPWSGVTDFKLKFGGKCVDYADAREIVYQPFWYWLIRLVKLFRR